MNPVHTPAPHLYTINPNITLPPMHTSSNLFLPSKPSDQNCLYISNLPTCTTWPAHLIHPNNICWRAQITKHHAVLKCAVFTSTTHKPVFTNLKNNTLCSALMLLIREVLGSVLNPETCYPVFRSFPQSLQVPAGIVHEIRPVSLPFPLRFITIQ
jgi:hypothetical protein